MLILIYFNVFANAIKTTLIDEIHIIVYQLKKNNYASF